MTANNPTVFISYSWDSKEHQQWVICLTNDLRSKGINALNDVFITQSGTVNLNKMMISQIRDSDYIIIVLTENYALKSDQVKGGVGFETVLTLPYVRENLSKLILIMRHKGDYTKVFPFHLKDVYAIDFSSDEEYEERLEELVYKILNIPLYEIKPLGPIPDLKPKTIPKRNPPDLDNLLIPRLKKITDKDKMEFLKDAYNQILLKFSYFFEQTKKVNEEFDYIYEKISTRKAIFQGYVKGAKKAGVKIWYGSSMGLSEGIFLSYGPFLDDINDNSYNEMIICEINNKNELQLKQTMNMFGNREKNDIDSIVQEIWLNHIKNSLER